MATNRKSSKKASTAIAFTAIMAIIVGGWATFTRAQDVRYRDDNSGKFTFALWGDVPYTPTDATTKVPALIDDINKSRVDFSVFDGDIKSGSSLCNNSVYTDAIARFNSFRAPMIYVPGDNEWTDCHRTNNGGFNSLERLAHIRTTMFKSPKSFGQRTLLLEHQGPLSGRYAENTRWMYGEVLFVGLNVPGSNNNKINSDAECTDRSDRSLSDCAANNAEYAARDAANISFLQQSFKKAKAERAVAIMVIIQADPSFDLPETEDIDERAVAGAPGGSADGYTAFLNAIVDETRAFKGQVVLVHGDTHFFKVDKPLLRQNDLLKNFTRVETFGEVNVHWVKVLVDPRSRNVFTFKPMIVPGN